MVYQTAGIAMVAAAGPKVKYKYYFWNFTLDFAHQVRYKRFYKYAWIDR